MAIAHILLALGIVLAAEPATIVKSASGSASGDAAAPTVAPNARPTKYCIQVQAFTGSRIAKSECETREEWSREGVDVDHPGKE